MNLHALTRSAAIAIILAGLVTFLPGLRKLQLVEAAGMPLPLPRYTETATLATQAPFCTDRIRIVQECALAALPGIQAIERQVIADLLALHQLPAGAASPQATPPPGAIVIGGEQPDLQAPQDNVSRLLSWERDTLRALVFDKIATIIEKAPVDRAPEERQIVDALAALVGRQRLAAATEAKRSYERWQSNPCMFSVPPGFEYTPPVRCVVPNALSSIFENPPSLEQFQAYGAFEATKRFSDDADLQAAAANAAKQYGVLGGAAAAGLAAVAGYGFAKTAIGGALAAAIFPYAAGGGAGAAGTAAVGTVAFAGAAAIIVVCVVIAVIAGITTFTAAETPAKLDAAIEGARTPPDLRALIAGEPGKQEIFGAFIATTVPAPGSPRILGGLTGWSPVPTARPDDPRFLLNPGPSQQASANLAFKGWERTGRVRLSEGWMVDETVATAPALTLHLDYINHAGEQWTAWRVGDRFLHTVAGDTKRSFVNAGLRYQDAAGANRVARILVPGLARPTANPTFSPPPTVAGWHNAPVTVTWNWDDNAGVGIDPAACPATSVLAPGEIASVTCTDLAGNRGSATASARVDMRAPVFTGPPTLSPAPNAAGWNNSNVTVSFSCSDGELAAIFAAGDEPSGIASCGPTQALTTEGRDQSVTGTATDAAGNTATQTASGINIDKTAPSFDAPAEQTIGGTSATGGRVVAPRAIDNLDPEPQVSCTPAVGSPLPLGPSRVTCTATDAAGNTSAPASFTLNIVPGCNGVVATIIARPGVPTVGTPGRDVIVGTDGPDEIRGGDGDDLICGSGGDDRVFGEGGSDTLFGDEGNDTLDGGAGQDELQGGAGDDTMLGGAANDWLEDREGMNQTFDGGGGDLNRCFGVSTAPPAGTVVNCQVRSG